MEEKAKDSTKVVQLVPTERHRSDARAGSDRRDPGPHPGRRQQQGGSSAGMRQSVRSAAATRSAAASAAAGRPFGGGAMASAAADGGFGGGRRPVRRRPRRWRRNRRRPAVAATRWRSRRRPAAVRREHARARDHHPQGRSSEEGPIFLNNGTWTSRSRPSSTIRTKKMMSRRGPEDRSRRRRRAGPRPDPARLRPDVNTARARLPGDLLAQAKSRSAKEPPKNGSTGST